MSRWLLSVHQSAELPPLVWLARVRRASVEVTCGSSVRHEGDAIFDGTWAGPADLARLPEATTTFGSGLVVDDDGMTIVTPSNMVEGVYTARLADLVLVSNSFVGLVVGGGLELDRSVPYSTFFNETSHTKWLMVDPRTRLLTPNGVPIPTQRTTVRAWFYENLRIESDLGVNVQMKPREKPFESYADYYTRLRAATTSLFANAAEYEPIVALSSGYDSTAVAAVAAAAGCRRAVGLSTARAFPSGSIVDDSGSATAVTLGLDMALFDRATYRRRDDLIEADFLCGGMSGEDVVLAAFEPLLPRSLLLTGYWAGGTWVKSDRYPPPHLPSGDLSGCSITDYRLLLDFIHVPLPYFGAFQDGGMRPFIGQPDMRPFVVGGNYDRPVPRRIAEEAGVARGTFARSKQAAAVPLQRGQSDWSAASVASIRRFAAANGERVDFKPYRPVGRPTRGVIKAAHRLGLGPLARPLERRRQQRTHLEPRLSNLVLRWAIATVAPRYAALRETFSDRSSAPANPE